MAMAPILRIMNTLCRLLPARTPRQFTAVSTANAVTAMTPSAAGIPLRSRKYRAKVIATAAIPPLCDTSSSVHA